MIFGKAKTTTNKNPSTRLRTSALFVARILSWVARTGKKRPALDRFSETGRYGAFSNNQEMAPILHKKSTWQSGKTKQFEVWGHTPEDKKKTNPDFQQVNKPYRISVHEVLQSWLINTVYHLLTWLWTISREEKGV